MVIPLTCIQCGSYEFEQTRAQYLETATLECPMCHTTFYVEYDEQYDEETGDEWDWFCLVSVKTSHPHPGSVPELP